MDTRKMMWIIVAMDLGLAFLNLGLWLAWGYWYSLAVGIWCIGFAWLSIHRQIKHEKHMKALKDYYN